MRKLRVGVWLYNNRKPQLGGAYGYYSCLVNKLKNYSFENADIIFISDDANMKQNYSYLIKWKQNKWIAILVLITNVFRTIPFLCRISNFVSYIKKTHDKKLEKELCKQVDIIYYLTPHCVYPNFPYIYTLWDIGHTSSYAFPELSMNQNFENRKSQSDLIPCKSLMIFADSNTGKQDIIKYLNINENRIRIVPIFPSEIVNSEISISQPKEIDKELFFIHYPAQYWAHKNHFNLLLALKEVLIENPNVKLVLTGYNYGNKEYIKKIIIDLKLTKSIVDLGFVSIEELKWLYVHSQGLVMPTFLGPTNMPLLEAAELGCPVACSNLPGHIEQLGDYGYYFDPLNPKDIALQINQMILNNKNGFVKKYQSKFNIENSLIAMDNAFSEIKSVRFCWSET